MIYDARKRPLHDLRVSLTDRCNFRCTYCMPSGESTSGRHYLAASSILTATEIERLVKILVKVGVRKVRFTGGEPLLRKDILTIIRRVRDISGIEDLALTTNGYLLERFAQSLLSAGLGRVNVSLDAMNDDVFGRINGVGVDVASVLSGIATARRVGLDPIKVNVVVIRGVNDREVLDIIRYFRGSGIVVRFIEFMDVGNCNKWQPEDVVHTKEIIRAIHGEYPLIPVKREPHDVAEYYRYADGAGELGFISSISRPFCGGCNRARLTSDGQLVTCLFSHTGVDLRTPLRNGASDDEIRDFFSNVWSKREDRYSEQRQSAHRSVRRRQDKVEMYRIGG